MVTKSDQSGTPGFFQNAALGGDICARFVTEK